MIRVFLFIVSVSCFLCGTVFAEGIRLQPQNMQHLSAFTTSNER